MDEETRREYRRRRDHAAELMAAHGLDALVVGSGPPVATSSAITVGSHGRFAQPRYHRWFSGFHIWGAESFGAQPVVVVLPRDGEPTLVVRAGTLRTWQTLGRACSWIDRVVATYREDEEWEQRTSWGLASPELPGDVAAVLEESGLAQARIGLVGSWPGHEATLARLPGARFEPTLSVGSEGEAVDLLAPLLATNSAWELRQLARSQAATEAAIRAFAAAARPGETLDRAVAEARYAAALAGAEDLVLELTSGTEPWALWIAPNQAPGARFRPGELVTVSAMASVEGYWVQVPRSWVLGTPSAAQQRALDTARHALEAMLERVEPGVTGGELWDAGLAVIRDAGLTPRGRIGHSIGFTTITGPEVFSMLPDNPEPLRDDVAFVLHPCVWDRGAGEGAQLGDSYVLENGACRPLSSDPVPLAPSVAA